MNEHPVNEPYKPNARETRIQIIKFALFSASAGIVETAAFSVLLRLHASLHLVGQCADGKSRLEQLRRPFSHHGHEPYF